jgi:hypothetical protein
MGILFPRLFQTSIFLLVIFSKTNIFAAEIIKEFIDRVGAGAIQRLATKTSARQQLQNLLFSNDNEIINQYDNTFGVYHALPEWPINNNSITDLINLAKKERDQFFEDALSGAIYEGSMNHMELLANLYEQAIKDNRKNDYIFSQGKDGFELATTIFKYFNTSNPLHGKAFPLAAKSLREIGAMLASLFDGERFAIACSGGKEALRIGMKALKKQAQRKYPNSRIGVLEIGRLNPKVSDAAQSLNMDLLNEHNQQAPVHIAVININKGNVHKLRQMTFAASK